MSDHILVVDDDADIRGLLETYLGRNGFRVTTAPDGGALWDRLEQSRFDLVILDVMLPGEDGFSLCRKLRAEVRTPVIMLTARGEPADRVTGLEGGADDYLPKPFEPRELLARIQSVLRRTRSLPDDPDAETARRIRFGGWTLDTRERQLTSPQGLAVALSVAEYRLLRVFLRFPGRVLERDQLMDLLQGRGIAAPADRSLDMQVSRLRQRLEDGSDGSLIRTVRGRGYLFSAAVEFEP